MPRKTKVPNGLVELPAADQAAAIVAATADALAMPADLAPVQHGNALAECATDASPEADFDPASIEQGHAAKFAARHEARRAVLERNPNVAGVAADYVSGVFVDAEKERQAGQVAKRVFVRFADGAEPTRDEMQIVKAEGFRYDREERAWAAPATAANKELAKRVANAVIDRRDPGGTRFYV